MKVFRSSYENGRDHDFVFDVEDCGFDADGDLCLAVNDEDGFQHVTWIDRNQAAELYEAIGELLYGYDDEPADTGSLTFAQRIEAYNAITARAVVYASIGQGRESDVEADEFDQLIGA